MAKIFFIVSPEGSGESRCAEGHNPPSSDLAPQTFLCICQLPMHMEGQTVMFEFVEDFDYFKNFDTIKW
jgi:hypothetical protein